MKLKLLGQAIIKFCLGLIITGLLIFIPAGSFNYLNGWLLIFLLFIPMFIAGLIMLFKNPQLLESRLNAKEKLKEQKVVVGLSGIMFITGFILAGLNYRYEWAKISNTIVILASILFIIAYILYAEVLRENSYLSRTIEVKENQQVIDTGLYSIVRHPMYLATLILFMAIPLILGSPQAFIVFLMYPVIIIKRIKSEEKLLTNKLKGYKEYKQKVKNRLIPYIW